MEYVIAARLSQQHQMVAADHSVAVADHRPPPVSQRTRRGSTATTLPMTSSSDVMATQQQQQRKRRHALEQEVAELKQQLSKEETVHEILERALQPSSARSAVLSIPAFIPSKAKELLAELVLVEEEIARLEAQIETIKQQHHQGEAKSMPATPPPPQQHHQGAPDPDNGANAKSPRPSAAATGNMVVDSAEIKSMFFISQAMAAMEAGDYLINKHQLHVNKAAGSPKSFALPPPSRHSLDKKQQQHPSRILHDELPIITTKQGQGTAKTNRTKREREPNKLSERIVKCLLCIFIRLLRSSRAADLEKSSAANLAGSFRIDTALNVQAAAAKDKDRGQQDHYGVFAVPDAIVRDIGPYKNLVRFTSTSLDLRGFSSSPLLTKLREMLEALQQVDLRHLDHHQRLAFWINIYNTCIMHGILQHGLPSNPEKLLALKNKATINVSGQKFNALVIENLILRRPSSVKEEFWKCDVEVEEQQVRELYGLKSSEPNILFALCCGIRSSPALRIYKAERVAMDLEKAKLEYLQASLVVTSTRRLLIPSLIHSNMHDFAKDTESLLRWICEQLPTSWPLRKSMVDCLRHHAAIINKLDLDDAVDVISFDYDFQYLLPM